MLTKERLDGIEQRLDRLYEEGYRHEEMADWATNHGADLIESARESLALADRVKGLEAHATALERKLDAMQREATEALRSALGTPYASALDIGESIRQLRYTVEGLRSEMQAVADELGCRPEPGAMVRRVRELRGKVEP